jgi:microcystin-dependent protein
MTACTKPPYLIKDGTVYNVSTYPALGQLLGSTFGGNGATTFGVPDERNRFRLPIDSGVLTNRVTLGVSGVNGQSFSGSGGSQSQQAHRHINTLSDPTHYHGIKGGSGAGGSVSVVYPGGGAYLIDNVTAPASTGISISNVTTGVGGSENMPPTIVNFIALIKT